MFQLVDITNNIDSNNANVTLICKYGCDGSSGYSEDIQKPSSSSSEIMSDDDINVEPISDTNLFLFTFVPLRIFCNANKNIWWQNLYPSSTRLCRPIKIIYKKESKKLIQDEVTLFKKEISELNPKIIEINNVVVTVNYSMHI